MASVQAPSNPRKRKSQFKHSDRLSKRLSLLNLERNNGAKLSPPTSQPFPNSPPSKPSQPPGRTAQDADNEVEDMMQLDDTKHKVYIYNIDDELSDSEASDDGKVLFHPDLQRRLKENRIQAALGTNAKARNDNQLVLYKVPTSLTVPEEKDGVRKAIIETRARARAKQLGEEEARRNGEAQSETANKGVNGHMEVASNNALNGGEAMEAVYEDPDAMDLG